MLSDYARNRKLEYTPGRRGDFVRFIQYIHDMVRIGQVKKLSSPLSAYWSISSRCNLSCKHCYAADNFTSLQNDLSLSDALKIVDILDRGELMEIILQGGEPFCYDHILDVIYSIKKRGMALSILTNGTLLQNENIDCVNNCLDSIDMVQISLDGAEKENDYIRGKGVFQKVLSNLKRVTFSNIVINCVVTDTNYNNLLTFVELLNNETNIGEIHFSPLMKLGRGKSLNYPDFEKAAEVYLAIKQKSRIKVSGSILPDIFLLRNPEKYDIDMSHIKLGCCAGRSKIFIDHSGFVYPCDYRMSQSEEKISLLKSDFSLIWQTSWQNQTESAYSISKRMATTKLIEPFCPSLYDE